MRRLSPLALFLLVPVAAVAQSDDSSPAAVAARVDAELGCVAAKHRELTGAARLLEESRAQLGRMTPGTPAHRDAATAIVSIEQRLHRIGTGLLECLPASARAGSQEVVYVEPPPDEAAEAVARVNPATDVIDEGRSLTNVVHVVRGEKVDGFGRVETARVRAAIDGVASGLDRCYQQLVERGALSTGQAVLSFRVDPRGRVRDEAVEGVTIADERFQRCLTQAARRIRIGAPAVGGDAVYSYTLRFGLGR